MAGKKTGRRLLRSPMMPVLGALVFLISAAITCGEIERRTESVDPMYQEDEIDVMVDYGATLQAEETAQARQGGPAKGPPSNVGEDMPSPPDDSVDTPPEPAEEAPPPPEDEPEPEAEEEQTTTNFAGSWHSAGTCDEEDAPYRWQVTIRQQPGSDQVSGTISFHDCPGGGRASYDVSGRATTENYVVLDGTKTSGRGDLNGVTPASQSFRITKGGEPFPNFAP